MRLHCRMGARVTTEAQDADGLYAEVWRNGDGGWSWHLRRDGQQVLVSRQHQCATHWGARRQARRRLAHERLRLAAEAAPREVIR